MIPIILLAFLIPIAIGILLYFTVVQKKLCNGDLHSCSASNVNLCVKSGTSDDDWKGMCTKLENKGNLGAGLGAAPSYNSCVGPQQKEKIRYQDECKRCISINNGTKPNFFKYWNGGPKGDAQDACYDVWPEPGKITPEPEKDDIVAFNYGTGAKAYMCENPGIITDPDKPCPDKGNLGTGLGLGPGNGQNVHRVSGLTINPDNVDDCIKCLKKPDKQSYWSDWLGDKKKPRNGCKDGYHSSSEAIKGDVVAFDYGPAHDRTFTCSNPGVVS